MENLIMKKLSMYIGEGFEGAGANAAHINILIGPRDGPVGAAFANSLAAPRQGHLPFMVIIKENVPVKPMTLYANKAEIQGDMHGNATWGASQAAIAKAVSEALLVGILPAESADDWCIVIAPWVNPSCNNLDEIFANNYRACTNAIKSAMQCLPSTQTIKDALPDLSNPFYIPKK